MFRMAEVQEEEEQQLAALAVTAAADNGSSSTVTAPPSLASASTLNAGSGSPLGQSFSARSGDGSADCCDDDEAVLGDIVQLPSPNAELVFVRISGTGTAKDSSTGSPYTAYFLEVKCLGAEPQQWTVHRRYNAFKALDQTLRRAGYRAPMLPPRRLLGQLDPDFVTQRRVDLESWLYQLIDYPNMDPSALSPQTCSTFRAFLLADANNPPFPMEVKEEESGTRLEGGSGGSTQGGVVGGWGSESQGAESDRRKMCLEDFELIKVIGKGSFGKVSSINSSL
jgi:PX domain